MSGIREIGGYFELERFAGQPYHRAEQGAIALNSGRACLEYLIELRGIKTIWLPDWLCDSVPNACCKHGVRVKTYSVGPDMRPEHGFGIADGEYLYLVDYYGQLDDGDMRKALEASSGHLIVDEAQAFFRRPWGQADTLYTCRKFFGVADGGYLYTKDGARLSRELARDESHEHMDFVLGRFERPASEFFERAKDNNKRFAGEGVRAMSALTGNVLRAVDYEGVKEARNKNWAYLHAHLGSSNRMDLKTPEGAFMYPLFLSESSAVFRGQLAKRRIYIPTLWPNVLQERPKKSIAYQYSDCILALPVDQRYEIRDLSRLLSEIRALIGE